MLNPLAENAVEWSSDVRKIAINREYIARLTKGSVRDKEALGNDDRNLRMVLKATIHENIWPKCDLLTAAQCFTEAIALEHKPGIVQRRLFAAFRASIATGNMRAFMLDQLLFATRILCLDSTEQHYDSTALEHLQRILDGRLGRPYVEPVQK